MRTSVAIENERKQFDREKKKYGVLPGFGVSTV